MSAWGVSVQEGGCLPGGGFGEVSVRGVCPGVCAWGDVCPEGVYWGCVSHHAMGQTPCPMDRQTDTCENITFENFVCGR